VGPEIDARDLAVIARHDRLQNRFPAICAVNVAGTKRAPFEVAELVEQEQRMVAGAGVVPVPDAVLLFAVRRAEARIHIEHDTSWRTTTMDGIDPLAGKIGERRARDLAGHGGEHRAVFVYQIDSYHYWQSQLGRNDFTYGQFGENFTVDGLSDQEVCIGDRYRIGSALLEVTQPRVTCYRVGIRMNEPQMAALLVAHGRPGFYFRVLEEGEVEAGDEIVQVAAAFERMTISEINALLYMPGHHSGRRCSAQALAVGSRATAQAGQLIPHANATQKRKRENDTEVLGRY
jgi:MOSC domain-containing protein YiiM